MATKPSTDDMPNGANDNHVGAVKCNADMNIALPPVTQKTGHLARLPTEEELRIRRVTAALRGRLAHLAAAQRIEGRAQPPDG